MKNINIYYDDYLLHYGVKGMKWGVRHDKPSLGQRYSNYGRRVSNKRYDKELAKIEERRKRRSEENFLRNTKYGKHVDRKSNERYDKKQQQIENRRANRNREFDEFGKALTKISNKKKALKIGAIAIGGILAAGSVAYLAKSGALSAVAKKGANVARGIFLKNNKVSAKVLTPHDYAWTHSKSPGVEILSNKPTSHNTFKPKSFGYGKPIDKNSTKKIAVENRKITSNKTKNINGTTVKEKIGQVNESYKNFKPGPRVLTSSIKSKNPTKLESDIFNPKVLKGTLNDGKKTVNKIVNSSGSKTTSDWEKLAKNNKDLLDKTLNFNMGNYTLDELRKLDLW